MSQTTPGGSAHTIQTDKEFQSSHDRAQDHDQKESQQSRQIMSAAHIFSQQVSCETKAQAHILTAFFPSVARYTMPMVYMAAPACLYFRQGLRTLQSVVHAVNACFFMPYIQFLMGRGGASSIKDPLRERLARRSLAVLNTPAFKKADFKKSKGVTP